MGFRPGAALLERDGEIEALTKRLEGACQGRGSMVALEGAAGIGKTSLIRVAAELAEQREMSVLQARGGVLEQSSEYGVARQLVERRLVGAPPEHRERLLSVTAMTISASSAPAAPISGRAAIPPRRSSTPCIGCSPTSPRSNRS